MIIQRTNLRLADTVSPLILTNQGASPGQCICKRDMQVCIHTVMWDRQLRHATKQRCTETGLCSGSKCHLNFDVPRAFDETLQKHALIIEGGLGLAPC